MQTTTFAARAGRWSARHRKTAIALWLAFVVAAVAAGQLAGLVNATQNQGTGESARAERTLQRAFPHDAASESVLVQARPGSRVRDSQAVAAIRAVTRAVGAQPQVMRLRSPLEPGNQGQLSRDSRSALVTFELRGGEAQAERAVVPVLAAVARVAQQHPAVTIGEFGDASAGAAISKAFSSDFQRAETLSLPLTLLILFLAFGSLVAAGVPLLLGITAVMAALGLVGVISHLSPMDESISSIILLIGLAVGVDYTLFYVRREREERRAGASTLGAVDTAAATSGRAVVVSGLTVIVAMAGMFLAGDRTFTSLGLGAILVVAVAMIGSLTVVPALLASLGDRIERGRMPFVGRRSARRSGAGRVWPAIVDGALRRPRLSALLAAGLLVVLALPAFSMHTKLTGTSDLPRSLAVMRVYDRMQAAFPGGQIPAVVAVTARDVRDPAVREAIASLRGRALASGRFHAPVDVTVSADHHVASVTLPMDGDGTSPASERALALLRGTLLPQTVGRAPGAAAYVTGMTAGTKDFNDLMRARAPLVFAFVLTLAFLLLLVTFRSIVVPVTAIALNLLSVGAAYGVLVWVFQDGHLRGPLAFHGNGAIVSWLPMFLFVILFGLSMDYHVFILSRVREAVDRGRRTEDAVREGILSTAGTVTSAAFVMVAVFAVFATLSQLDFKEMGVGLAVAILIDATIVRAVLLPATMSLLGERNWYLPSWLQWLPRVSWEGAVAADDDEPGSGPAERAAARRRRRELARA
ncbi:MAG TPA: MMPL family transporter [Solirubrobacteraceae bacterium]|nr:MMPL family transporter [Solirubrobacteraceae bacterium]